MFLIVPLSSVCQDDKNICIERSVAINIAKQIDSFEVLKAHQVKYIAFQDECNKLVLHQEGIIESQDTLISNNRESIIKLKKIDELHIRNMEENVKYINKLERKIKGAKIRNKIFLIGGGVVITVLVTSLVIIAL